MCIEFKPLKNNYLAPIAVLKKDFIFSIDIKPLNKVRGWSTVARITDSKKDCCDNGNRIPLVIFKPNSFILAIAFSINGNGNRVFYSAPLKQGEYTTVVIKQTLKYGNEYRYSITINGKEVFQTSNNKARDFRDVKLYAGDNYYAPSDCMVKNILFENIGMCYYIMSSSFFFSDTLRSINVLNR